MNTKNRVIIVIHVYFFNPIAVNFTHQLLYTDLAPKHSEGA